MKPTHYTLIERLWNVEFNKIMFCFGDYFSKVAEYCWHKKDSLIFWQINQVSNVITDAQ